MDAIASIFVSVDTKFWFVGNISDLGNGMGCQGIGDSRRLGDCR
jgi:hypothetical protein